MNIELHDWSEVARLTTVNEFVDVHGVGVDGADQKI